MPPQNPTIQINKYIELYSNGQDIDGQKISLNVRVPKDTKIYLWSPIHIEKNFNVERKKPLLSRIQKLLVDGH